MKLPNSPLQTTPFRGRITNEKVANKDKEISLLVGLHDVHILTNDKTETKYSSFN